MYSFTPELTSNSQMTRPALWREPEEWTEPTPLSRLRRAIWPLLVIALLVGVALAALAWVNWPADDDRPEPVGAGTTKAEISLSSLPPQARLAVTDPLARLDVPLDKARKINAAVPFVANGLTNAAPFLSAGPLDDRERATKCLAAAAYYEAGDDLAGEQAVAQVVLNRVRHPLFPKSVCGVVFQGSERRTGCQFSFTCDGSMARRQPSAAAWARARLVAADALDGRVYAPVGLATHFHTNWVVPYWSGAMDKIAQVGTHLFFRWRGRVGDAATFSRAPVAKEPIEAVAGLPTAGDDDLANVPLPVVAEVAPPVRRAAPVEQTEQVDDKRLLRIDPAAAPESFAFGALQLCRGMTRCQVYGYVDPAAAGRNWASVSGADFYYDGGVAGSNTGYWNCRKFDRPIDSECLPGTVYLKAADVATVDLDS